MNLQSVKDAAIILGKSHKTLYCLASRDRSRNINHRFQKISDTIFVNIDAFEDGKPLVYDAVSEKTQFEFERLYFLITDRQTKQSTYEFISKELNKKPSAVRGYFYDCFLTGTETTKQKYIQAMNKLLLRNGYETAY